MVRGGAHVVAVKFFKSTRQHKKYKVTFVKNNKTHTVHFGDLRYQHYKDWTPLKLYTRLNHNNAARRANYLARARGIVDKQNRRTCDNPLKANYWAIHYLW